MRIRDLNRDTKLLFQLLAMFPTLSNDSSHNAFRDSHSCHAVTVSTVQKLIEANFGILHSSLLSTNNDYFTVSVGPQNCMEFIRKADNRAAFASVEQVCNIVTSDSQFVKKCLCQVLFEHFLGFWQLFFFTPENETLLLGISIHIGQCQHFILDFRAIEFPNLCHDHVRIGSIHSKECILLHQCINFLFEIFQFCGIGGTECDIARSTTDLHKAWLAIGQLLDGLAISANDSRDNVWVGRHFDDQVFEFLQSSLGEFSSLFQNRPSRLDHQNGIFLIRMFWIKG
mmetsp:Transcript_42768/g.103459  ORF Transcript_42768/g.103459 Transcript_42768/m.103459 type:complete len:284 (+) Transcript_42768:404-1255(+)